VVWTEVVKAAKLVWEDDGEWEADAGNGRGSESWGCWRIRRKKVSVRS